MHIYDPKVEPEQIIEDLTHPCVTDSPESVQKAVEIFNCPYTAVRNTHAIVVCTEWDNFVVSTVFPLQNANVFYSIVNLIYFTEFRLQ